MTIDSDTAHVLTRLLMAASFVTAMMLCARSSSRGLAVFYLVATVETYTKLRYPLHNEAKEILLASTVGELGKQQLQVALIAGLTVVAAVVAIWLAMQWRRATWPRVLMTIGMLGTLCFCAIEMISLHAIDAFIYTVDGVFLRSGLIYAAFAMITSVGAVIVGQRGSNHKELENPHQARPSL
jgi:hypothetical protein